MSSRKRRIKRKIEVMLRMQQQGFNSFCMYKTGVLWANANAIGNALYRKGLVEVKDERIVQIFVDELN